MLPTGGHGLVVAACDASNPQQQWTFSGEDGGEAGNFRTYTMSMMRKQPTSKHPILRAWCVRTERMFVQSWDSGLEHAVWYSMAQYIQSELTRARGRSMETDTRTWSINADWHVFVGHQCSDIYQVRHRMCHCVWMFPTTATMAP